MYWAWPPFTPWLRLLYLRCSIWIYCSIRSCSSNCFALFNSFSCIFAAITMSWSLGSIFLSYSVMRRIWASFSALPFRSLLSGGTYPMSSICLLKISWLACGFSFMPTRLFKYAASSGSCRWFRADDRCSGSTPPLSTVSISKSLLFPTCW